jgi:hypothetical protein
MSFKKLIPNETGIPNQLDDAAKVRKAHGYWKKEMKKRRCQKYEHMSYWEVVSTCTAL